MSETKHIHRAYISNSQTRTRKYGISRIKFIINVGTVTRIQTTWSESSLDAAINTIQNSATKVRIFLIIRYGSSIEEAAAADISGTIKQLTLKAKVKHSVHKINCFLY